MQSVHTVLADNEYLPAGQIVQKLLISPGQVEQYVPGLYCPALQGVQGPAIGPEYPFPQEQKLIFILPVCLVLLPTGHCVQLAEP
jgi:hypothetical protein